MIKNGGAYQSFRLIFNAKLVTADPILTNGSMEIILKESTLYLVLYRKAKATFVLSNIFPCC
jgi:hypothetical protein